MIIELHKFYNIFNHLLKINKEGGGLNMLRKINKITTDTYIPFAFHFGTNYTETPNNDSLAKECLRVVLYRSNQNPDNGHIMVINKVTSLWLHTISTSTSSMDIACSMRLNIDQEMPYQSNDMNCNICIDIDIINIFKKLTVFTDYNKYNIDPTILWEKINFWDRLSYRIYDTSQIKITLFNRGMYDSDNQQWSLYDTPPYRIKSAGITVDSYDMGRVICPVNPTKLYQIEISFNTTMHIMTDIFSIKNLDLLKKKP